MILIKTSVDQLDVITASIVLACLLSAAVTDLRFFKVYDTLTVPMFLSGLFYNTSVCGWAGLKFGLLGAACAFGLLILGCLLGQVGGGDLKLMMGLGAWLGPWMTFKMFLAGTMAGAAFALVVIACTGQLRQTVWRLVNYLLGILTRSSPLLKQEKIEDITDPAERRRRLIPFAAALCLGVPLAVYLPI